MTEGLYIETLNWFKQNEKPEIVLLLKDNPDFIRLIIAWANLDSKPLKKPKGTPGESENKRWEWLWENTKYSIKDLKEKIGTSLSENALRNKIKPLIGNRIIYPDGSINSFVERYLREQVVQLFEKNRK
ncbi:MAG: hypothetical protein JSU79_01450 [Dehalococcoidales bacterium]|nr:MAG: hypothetical protein JSU79_01450 [Dehalococcoidales bacterium]